MLSVDEEIGEARLRNVLHMALVLVEPLVQVADVIVQCRGIEEVVGIDAQSRSAAIGLLPPAHVTLQSRLLRTYVGIELLVGGLLVDAHALRELAVGVVLHGATSVEAAVVHGVGQLHDMP